MKAERVYTKRKDRKEPRAALKALLRIHGEAGLIALDRQGRLAIMHTTDYMVSGYAKGMRIQVQQRARRVRQTRS